MKLIAQINENIKTAMRAKDTRTLSTLRLLKSGFNKALIKDEDLTDELVISAVRKEIKKREDTIVFLTGEAHAELREGELAEAQILNALLPAALTPEELNVMVEKAIALLNPGSAKEMGKIIKHVTAEAKGRADGKTISTLVKEKLQLLFP